MEKINYKTRLELQKLFKFNERKSGIKAYVNWTLYIILLLAYKKDLKLEKIKHLVQYWQTMKQNGLREKEIKSYFNLIKACLRRMNGLLFRIMSLYKNKKL